MVVMAYLLPRLRCIANGRAFSSSSFNSFNFGFGTSPSPPPPFVALEPPPPPLHLHQSPIQLLAVPKRKVSKSRKGIRNGPKALKPHSVIIKCLTCGRIRLPHYYCCGGERKESVVPVGPSE